MCINFFWKHKWVLFQFQKMFNISRRFEVLKKFETKYFWKWIIKFSEKYVSMRAQINSVRIFVFKEVFWLKKVKDCINQSIVRRKRQLFPIFMVTFDNHLKQRGSTYPIAKHWVIARFFKKTRTGALRNRKKQYFEALRSVKYGRWGMTFNLSVSR